jgi:hypothetical protein
VNEVHERLLPADLDDGYALAVAALELRVAADVDLHELERNLGANVDQNPSRRLAEVTALRAEEANGRDGFYG